MKKNLIFDVGGVLIRDDFEARTSGLDLSDERREMLRPIFSHEHEYFDDFMCGRLTQVEYMQKLLEMHPDFEREIHEMYDQETQLRVMPVIEENVRYILSLRNRGYCLYLLTNMGDGNYLHIEDIIKQFDGGAYSFKAGMTKPNPEFYKLLLNSYDLRPEDCIFFDDREGNVKVGQDLGIESHIFHTIEDVERAIS